MLKAAVGNLGRCLVQSLSVSRRGFSSAAPMSLSPKKALVVMAHGSEEMESVISIDVLRRATVNVTVAGLTNRSPVMCNYGVVIVPDLSLEEAMKFTPYDVVVLPGGLKGAERLCKDPLVGKLLRDQEKSGKIVAAICAATTALKAHGIGTGKMITSFPPLQQEFLDSGLYQYKEDRVVVDGNLITSRGPGTTFEFALTLVDQLGHGDKIPAMKKFMVMKEDS